MHSFNLPEKSVTKNICIHFKKKKYVSVCVSVCENAQLRELALNIPLDLAPLSHTKPNQFRENGTT